MRRVLLLSVCGSMGCQNKLSELADIRNNTDAAIVLLTDFVVTNVDLDEIESRVASKTPPAARTAPADDGGPAVVSVDRGPVGLAGGAAVWTVTLDAPADTVYLQFDDEDTYHAFEADGTTATLVFYYRSEIATAWDARFSGSRDRFCDTLGFSVPPDIPPNSRYTDFYDSLGPTLDLLCLAGVFDATAHLDVGLVNTFFPERAAGSVRLTAEAGGVTGPTWEDEQDVQRVDSGSQQVSLYFSPSTDLDLQVIESGTTEISVSSPESAVGGRLDLDSNPGCSLDSVDNEHISWDARTPGEHELQIAYTTACTEASVGFVLSTVDGSDLTLYEGSLEASDEGTRFSIDTFVVP